EIAEVVDTLRSGWLTTGPRVKRFEEDLAAAVGAPHAIALNSCTAALHLAVEALGLRQGQSVLVPTMTFAATAEVVRYAGAVPVLVDCDPVTLNMDLEDAERRIKSAHEPVGIIPVHVGGLMMDVGAISAFAERHGLWVIEDAAHALPAAWRRPDGSWQRCGEGTAAITCFSFYANKTVTTGEGGMATTADPALAERMRMMSLHGLSHDAWGRFSKGGTWDYRILAPGFKYNLTDVAAALGIHQLARAEEMRKDRERLARRYLVLLSNMEELELPPVPDGRIHSWHLFPVKLRLEKLSIDRNSFIAELKDAGVGCSVHWRPLHLHPYYAETFGWRAEDLPAASAVWERIVSLPLFPAMTDAEHEHVVAVVQGICERCRRKG
ncbi:MAG TPA: DegT/DnrJ/EryC1/StrS family aminotransferase, partial [Thermoanaerobaculia bacterium]|nr:DegT/DnrJ/EryC1/StrS family aminotransferase [Thermoanaerobaculia bacterium]